VLNALTLQTVVDSTVADGWSSGLTLALNS